MKYTKIAALAALPVLGIGIFGASQVASAHGIFKGFSNATPEEIAIHHTEMFEHQSEILGLSVEEIKQAWAEGKDMKELMEEKGIDVEAVHAKMRAERESRMQEHMQTLVEKGVITEEQAQARLETMKNNKGKVGEHIRKGGLEAIRPFGEKIQK